jgi:hypothetical protein
MGGYRPIMGVWLRVTSSNKQTRADKTALGTGSGGQEVCAARLLRCVAVGSSSRAPSKISPQGPFWGDCQQVHREMAVPRREERAARHAILDNSGSECESSTCGHVERMDGKVKPRTLQFGA